MKSERRDAFPGNKAGLHPTGTEKSRQLLRGLRAGLLGVLGVCLTPATAAEGVAPSVPVSIPLAARSGPRGPTLFTTLSPEQTGIMAYNAYDDPAMWAQLYREFNNGAIGTGIAIGDYDGDDKPDVFVVNKTGPNHLFRNLGGFRFEDVTEQAGVAGPVGAWKHGAAFADVNNDGRLDLYVCRFAAPNLLFVNQGDGTFREEAAARGLALADASNMAAFCDYDRDGWLDVYVQTNVLESARQSGQRDHLYRNNRDGTFAEVTDAAGITGVTQGHSAIWGDFDEDGWPDLYVANDFAEPDQLYRNNRDGTFTNILSAVVPHTPHFSMGADLADLNNDGHLDLLVPDMAASTRVKDHRGMARMRSMLREDEQRPKAAPQYMKNALFLGTGTGRMLEAAHLTGMPATDWTFGVRLEDLDLDGRIDAYFTNGMVREFHNSDLVQRCMAAGNLTELIRIVKASPQLAEPHLAFRNQGDLRFENVSAAWGLGQVGISFGAAFGDLDGDGDLDLVFANYNGEPTVCRNDAETGHALEVALRGTASNRFGVGATVRIETADGAQMRTLTLARGYLSTSEPLVHFGLGTGTTIPRLTVEWPSGRHQSFTDLPADRRYTLTEPEPSAPPPPPLRPAPQFTEVSSAAGLDVPNHEQPLDEFKLQPLLPFRLNRPGPSAVFADLNADGEDELVIGGVAGEPCRLFLGPGRGRFSDYFAGDISSLNVGVADGPILVLDADADGDLDLLVTKAGVAAPPDSPAYQPTMWLNDGRGGFAAAPAGTLPSLPISVGAAAAADFEHRGRLGIFIGGRAVPGRYPQAPRSALLAWRNGRYVDVTAEVAPALSTRGMVTAALWSDVDSDGWPDLLVAYDWGQVACYRNVDGQHFEDVTEKLGFAAGTGWWRSLASADFNGDGKPDYVAGNCGLNTRYRASVAEPALLYADVVLDGSAPQLVEAQAENGRWYPLRTRETMLRAFPSLARRFPTSDSYARATLDDVFPSATLQSATKFAASELRSGIFLSQPDGTYRFAPLPRLAQIAPIHGIAAGDFDGDGRTDLAVVGNSYAPYPESGRFDGGLGWFLRGDGAGHFTPVPPAESGLVVARDARALAVTDLGQDGWPDIFVTRNNDSSLAFRNQGQPGRHSFGVTLVDLPGNPTAVGARITLQLADGSTQTAEVCAGSGYQAQSSATVFFGYPDSARPARLQVRWPDGRKTERVFTAPPPNRLRLSRP